jgi:putative oxidoreductase
MRSATPFRYKKISCNQRIDYSAIKFLTRRLVEYESVDQILLLIRPADETSMTMQQLLSAVIFRRPVASTRTVIILSRLIVGYGFLQHGYAKVSNGPEHFASILSGLGVPAAEIMSRVTIAAELICGAGILAGALVPLLCIPMAVILLVAMIAVHLPFGFSSIKLQAVTSEGIKFGSPGYEVILLYLVSLVTLFVLGAGPLSIDGWLAKRSGAKQS